MVLDSHYPHHRLVQSRNCRIWSSSSSISPQKSHSDHDIVKSVYDASKSSNVSIASSYDPELVLYEFQWRHDGRFVILTGTFDQWQGTIHMKRDHDSGYFYSTLFLDPKRKWIFKFIVDGVWRCSLDFLTEIDIQGNVNNVIYPINITSD